MSYREQIKYFEFLRRYEKKFNPGEIKNYTMFLKRHKDEEELDKLSLNILKEMFEKYHLNRLKPDLDKFFKKVPGTNADNNQ